MPFSRDALERYLAGLPPHGTHLLLADLLEERPIACIDGRKHDMIAGVPGGNAGLFILMIGALETHRGMPLRPQMVERLFPRYLDRFDTFYLHSDTHALERLDVALRNRGVLDSDDSVERLMQDPPLTARDPLLDLLGQPEHMGCGHLRLMTEHPATYGIRPVLIRHMIHVFFRHRWMNDGRCIFDVLEGDHAEEAILCMHPSDTEEDAIPMHTPMRGGEQVFVYHPRVEAYMYAQHARFLANQDLIDTDDRLGFIHTQRHLGERQRTATIKHLAPHLPLYHVMVADEGLRVTEAVG